MLFTFPPLLKKFIETSLFLTIITALAGCGGGGSDVGDFEHLQKQAVVAGIVPQDHWTLEVDIRGASLRLIYRNEGDEDFEWLRIMGTNANKELFFVTTDREDLSNSVFLAGEQQILELDLANDIEFPLYFWATYVTVHEVIVHDCAYVEADGAVTECGDEPPEEPEKGFQNAYYVSY